MDMSIFAEILDPFLKLINLRLETINLVIFLYKVAINLLFFFSEPIKPVL